MYKLKIASIVFTKLIESSYNYNLFILFYFIFQRTGFFNNFLNNTHTRAQKYANVYEGGTYNIGTINRSTAAPRMRKSNLMMAFSSPGIIDNLI